MAQGFRSAEGLTVIADGTSVLWRAAVQQQLVVFGPAARGLEIDAIIGGTVLERGLTLITGDQALATAVTKLGGIVRFFNPGG